MINHMNNYMGYYGINAGYLGYQLFYFFVMLIPLILSIIVLFSLRSRKLDQKVKALWVLIAFFPVLGPVAYWIVNPQEETISE